MIINLHLSRGILIDQAIFLLQEVIGHYQSNATPPFICFMDVSKAYDKYKSDVMRRLVTE